MNLSRRALLAGLLATCPAGSALASAVAGPRRPRDGPQSLAGSFLVAPPGLDAGPFSRSVVFVLHHDPAGAMGVIVNKPVEVMTLGGLLADRRHGAHPAPHADIEVTIRFGGPVQPDAAIVVHSPEFRVDGTKPVASFAAVSPADAVVAALADGKGPQRYAFFAGYAGWGPTQLDSELAKGWWFTEPGDETILFGNADSTKWQRALDHRTIDL